MAEFVPTARPLKRLIRPIDSSPERHDHLLDQGPAARRERGGTHLPAEALFAPLVLDHGATRISCMPSRPSLR